MAGEAGGWGSHIGNLSKSHLTFFSLQKHVDGHPRLGLLFPAERGVSQAHQEP